MVIIWVTKIFFVQLFCVLLPPLFNIFYFCKVPTISVLYWAHLCMKYSLGISNFLEEISSLSHSVVFLYFFALITEEGFFYLFLLFFGTLHSSGYIFPFLLCLLLLFFSQLFVRPPQTSICFFHFFSMGMVLIAVSYRMSWTSFHSSSGTLSIRSRPLNLFLTSTV